MDKEKVIELFDYMITCIIASDEKSLCDFEVERMYELLDEIKKD